MTLAIDINNGRGLSKKAHHELLLKKSKVMLYFCSFRTKGDFSKRIECVCIAICFLVMSLCSSDLLINNAFKVKINFMVPGGTSTRDFLIIHLRFKLHSTWFLDGRTSTCFLL